MTGETDRDCVIRMQELRHEVTRPRNFWDVPCRRDVPGNPG